LRPLVPLSRKALGRIGTRGSLRLPAAGFHLTRSPSWSDSHWLPRCLSLGAKSSDAACAFAFPLAQQGSPARSFKRLQRPPSERGGGSEGSGFRSWREAPGAWSESFLAWRQHRSPFRLHMQRGCGILHALE
ncbi:Hypothetical predicted protein, partial [Podarcis lilfordi]